MDYLLHHQPSAPTVGIALNLAALLWLYYIVIAGAANAATVIVQASRKSQSGIDSTSEHTPILRNILWSIPTALIFAYTALLIIELNNSLGFLQIYHPADAFGWLWFCLSLPVGLLVHDFYGYWLNRILHRDYMQEMDPSARPAAPPATPFAALAFHPSAAILHISGIFLIPLLIPISGIILVAILAIFVAMNAMLHAAEALSASESVKRSTFKFLNVPAGFSPQHPMRSYNFGLYTLIWDRAFGTLHPHSDATSDASQKQRRLPLQEGSL